MRKKLVLSYELFFKYGGEGGLTRFARPAGSPLTVFVVCPTGCASCRTPVGASHPPWSAICEKKSSHFRTSSSLNMAVRGGLTRFARPAGSPLTVFVVCPTGCASCRTPVGASHPPWSAICEKKSSHFRTSSSLNMAVRGGFEPPIRCRIHTFQACSFSHSDTSPNCFATKPHGWQRGATIGSWSKTVKKNFNDNYCLLIL